MYEIAIPTALYILLGMPSNIIRGMPVTIDLRTSNRMESAMLRMQFTCYDYKSGSTKIVEVSGDSTDDCASAALKRTGFDRIAGARVLSGDLGAEVKSGKIVLK